MKRKIVKELLEWKSSEYRKPIILYGARQVGKTYTALNFGKENYKNTVYFNMEDSKEIANVFERDLNPERIVKELSVIANQNIMKEDTLIIFDEIQTCERALTSLKYFYENAPEYHIMAAGSLLGVAVNRERYSFPVGKVDMKTLYPLNFEEFLEAIGQERLIDVIRESFENNMPMTMHETALDLYKTYLVVGGMPRAVLNYIEKKDFNFVLAEQKSINDSYIADMAKYATTGETTKIMDAFNSVPAQLAKDNKKFQYRIIKSGARSYDYDMPISWLSASGVINKCMKVTQGELPLIAHVDNDSFKVYMTDTGLLWSKYSVAAEMIIHGNNELNGIKGALTENYVCSELIMNSHEPFYWESDGKAEVDFVIQNDLGEIIPIEVKSEDNVKAKSLKIYIARYNPKYAIRVSSKNFGFENGIKSVPLYAVWCI